MQNDYIETETNDGSRHFVDMPEVVFFDEFYDHTEKLEEAEIIEFTVDGVVEMRLDFEFRGHKFLVNTQFGDYRFFVENSECPEEILLEVIAHYSKLMER